MRQPAWEAAGEDTASYHTITPHTHTSSDSPGPSPCSSLQPTQHEATGRGQELLVQHRQLQLDTF